MKTIIVYNDGSAEAEHAAKMALNIAHKVNADLLLANVFKEWSPVKAAKYVLVAEDNEKAHRRKSLIGELISLNTCIEHDFKPQISFVDASEFSVADLAQLIIKNNIWMMVKGIKENAAPGQESSLINIHCVLNRVMCPLLLVPENYQIKDFERMVYMADLRYCQLPVVKYLAQLAKPYCAKLQIAHIAAKGLPDMEEHYAEAFFSEAISSAVNYDRLFFNNIKEKNLRKVVDVMIHGLHADLIVLINHQFHFEELMGRYITHTLPEHITVPLLVFPC